MLFFLRLLPDMKQFMKLFIVSVNSTHGLLIPVFTLVCRAQQGGFL